MDELRQAHDELLKNKPDTAVHDETDCIFCNEEFNSEGGGDMKTFTEDELNAAVEAAIEPVQAELNELKNAQAQGEVDTRVAEANAEADRRVAEVQTQLDEAMVQKGAAEKELSDTVDFLVAEEAAKREAAEIAARTDERKVSIEELAVFEADYVEANMERWLALEDEDFAALVEDWKTIASSKASESEGEESETTPIPDSAMNSTRDSAGSSKTDDFSDILGARKAGVNIHNIY
jgi:hypothetical protein